MFYTLAGVGERINSFNRRFKFSLDVSTLFVSLEAVILTGDALISNDVIKQKRSSVNICNWGKQKAFTIIIYIAAISMGPIGI